MAMNHSTPPLVPLPVLLLFFHFCIQRSHTELTKNFSRHALPYIALCTAILE